MCCQLCRNRWCMALFSSSCTERTQSGGLPRRNNRCGKHDVPSETPAAKLTLSFSEESQLFDWCVVNSQSLAGCCSHSSAERAGVCYETRY